MKCKNCGSDMSLEDEKCGFCDTENPYYKEHRESMQRYKEQFEKTRTDVYEKTERFSGIIVKVTIVAVLVALNFICALFRANSWEINNKFLEMKGNRNMELHKEKLYEMERAGDYIDFVEYYNANKLYYIDELDEFTEVKYCCTDYEMIYKNIVKITIEKNTKSSADECVLEINEYLDRLYSSMSPDEYYNEDCYSKEHVRAMQEIKNRIHALLHTYCNVSQGDLEHFAELSSTKRQLLIREGVRIYEEQN